MHCPLELTRFCICGSVASVCDGFIQLAKSQENHKMLYDLVFCKPIQYGFKSRFVT